MKRIRRLAKGIMTCVLTAALVAGSFAGIGNNYKAEAKSGSSTSYTADQLLYWRVDDGAEKPTIMLKTNSIPINFTYTEAKDSYLPIDASGSSYFVDNNAGSKKSYLDTLYNAGVVKDVNDMLVHPNRLEPNNSSLYDIWAVRRDIYRDGVYVGPATDDLGNYIYEFNVNAQLPSVLTEEGMLSYKVNYEGNAILVPRDALTYYADVQGNMVEVEYDGGVKLEYAVEKSNVSAQKANWILGTNTVTVRLEAEYTYTKLVPITDGKYEEKKYQGTSAKFTTQYGTYGRTIAGDGTGSTDGNDTCIPVYSGGSKSEYADYGKFTSKVYDYISGKTFDVVSNCPVVGVKETIKYYYDVECYLIDTDMVKNDGKDKNVYLKDFFKKAISTEDYRFTNNKSKFNVKWKYDTGFTVTGISRNPDLTWINGTQISESMSGFDGELIEWWAGQSTEHHYSTPENLNDDINVERYLDYGVTLYFLDVNKPVKVATVTIPARAKASSIKVKETNGVLTIAGLKPKQTAVRLCDANGDYVEITGDALDLFSTTYLNKGDSTESAHGDQSFYTFNGGVKGKDTTIKLLNLFGLADNKNFNVIQGMYIETQNKVSSKAPSCISALYINAQDVFTTGKSKKQASITLNYGSITIADADSNNVYEYCIPDANGNPTKWKKISGSSAVKNKAIVDGTTIYLRKAAKSTKDAAILLPSTYIELTYNGNGKKAPNVYYMDDLYEKDTVTVKLINDTNKAVNIGNDTVAAGGSLNIGTANVVFRQYIDKNSVVIGLDPSSKITVAAGTKVVEISGIDNSEIKLSELLSALKNKYGNEWTTPYYREGISSVTATLKSYSESMITKADTANEAYKKTIKIDGETVTYYPVHLLRYMLEG